MARALAAAHIAQIIHRDLKPANIFLHREPGTEGNIVKVLDFGVSKNLGATDLVATVAGGLVGSPAYMSPEQIRVDRTLDHRTDIWSFGVILFEMLTGVRPFQGTAQEIVNKILTAEVPPVSRFVRRSRCDPASTRIRQQHHVDRCSRTIAGFPVDRGPHSGTSPSASADGARRKRVAMMIVAASALVTVAGGALMWFVLGPRLAAPAGQEAPAKPPEAPRGIPVPPPPPNTVPLVQPAPKVEPTVPPAASIAQPAPAAPVAPVAPPVGTLPPGSLGAPSMQTAPASKPGAPISKPPAPTQKKGTFF